MVDKADRVKARLPRGFVDRAPDDIRAADEMIAKIRGVYELYGFEPVETPMIEFTDALGKFLPDQDRPNEGVFSFQDDDSQEARSGGAATGKQSEWMSLRYDLTAPLARYVAENFERLPKPYRSYRAGWVFRNEKPGPGRFRQFMQFDADTVGTPTVAADAEMAMMMADVMEAVGIARGDYVIRVNNRKVLDGVLEAIGVSNAGQKLTVLRAIDKLDKFEADDVRLLLGPGRWDGGKEGEGDFTKGAGLDEEQITRLGKFIDFARWHEFTSDSSGRSVQSTLDTAGNDWTEDESAPRDMFAALDASFGENEVASQGITELKEIAALVAAAGYGEDRIRIDPSVVRGLEYYTGPVFEAELLFEVPNEKGEIVRFGSVAGGGRYDGLVSRFRGEPVPATGFSIGVSRLMTALKNLGKLDAAASEGPVVVLAMDRDTESLGCYQKMVAELRAAGIRAEMYLGGSGMKAQMKYADRRGSPCVVIQGGDERAAGTVQIKDMVEGARQAAAIAGHEEYKEVRPGQVTVPEGDLVAEVRKVLDAQAAERAKG